MAVQLNPRSGAVFEQGDERPRRRFTMRRLVVWGGLAAIGYAGWRYVRARRAGHAGYETRPTLPAEKAIRPARPASVPVHGTPT